MPTNSTQDFLEIKDIREGVIILKNNSIRGILMVSSLNFALKSEEEQTAIIYAYQSFLNSLDFSCQIIIQSRKINITPYLDGLQELERRQTSDLMRQQTASYRKFIKEMVRGDMVMTKNFYVVIPYELMEIFGASGITKQFDFLKNVKGKKQETQEVKDQDFERCKTISYTRGCKRECIEFPADNKFLRYG